MKQILLTFFALLFATLSFSQNLAVKFMGIPVDGTKSEMINALKVKGFNYNSNNDYLTGTFNGMNVIVNVSTYKNKVDRIMVTNSEPINGQQIKSQYNELVSQFNNNEKYIKPGESDYNIPEKEDIYLGIAVDKKRYQAIYYQMINFKDPNDVKNFSKYIYSKTDSTSLSKLPQNEQLKKVKEVSAQFLTEVAPKRVVWFMISGELEDYYISLFYDNEYNRPNGEDL